MRYVAALLALFLILPISNNSHAQTDIPRVCLILNLGQVDDGTFNQDAYEGMLAVADDYVLAETDTTYLLSNSADDYTPNIQQCLDEGFDIVVTVGFALADLTLQAAEANPDIFFIGVDHFVDNGPTNYAGIQFRDDEAGFLVGYLAGLVTQTRIVGGVYGPPFPPLKRFRNGFEQGVQLAATERGERILTLGTYLDDFNLMDEGEAAAQTMLYAGADVIFGAGGLTGSAAIMHAAEQGVYVIGVDQDEYFTTFQGGEVPGAEYLISSALKRVDVGVYDMLAAIMEGDMESFPGGSNYVLSVSNNGIAFANRNAARFCAPGTAGETCDEIDPVPIYDAVIAVENMLAADEITTGVDPISGDLLAPAGD